jgi:hypothetical protein
MNTWNNSPIPHQIPQYCTQCLTHFSGWLETPQWTNIAPNIIPIVIGHYNNSSDSRSKIYTNFSGPLEYPVWFTNIAPKYPPIIMGHYNTHVIHQCYSQIHFNESFKYPLIHQYCAQIPTHLSGPLQCTIQFTNSAPKLTPISVGQFNTLSDSPILHPNTHPF